ncbi:MULTISPECIES: transporter [Pontibacillus]|uniref:Transporter n=1 Tax=Pontibacillus chungwhensis TaxID=265426 RepID=A0ABY8UZT4_9BACI|nr:MULTISPECIES: transporter [Pontibacillus]MCD5325706.1 transporter [Pontibacillus sp. HN14]WIF98054.1 transporter [Pontibacillus chungwhensis]
MKIFKRLYEGIMVLLVMVTIMTLWSDRPYDSVVNWIVWGIFMIDFLIRLVLTKNKWEFVKQNPFLVVAVIPFDQFFQMARIVRIIYLFRIKTITKYYVEPLINRLTYKSKIVLFGLMATLLAIESSLLWMAEGEISTFSDAFLMIGRQLLFFGHQSGISLSTFSIIMLVFTSILGVVLHGLALQWIIEKGERVVKGRLKSSERHQDLQKDLTK